MVAEHGDGFGEWMAVAGDGRQWVAATNGVANVWDGDELTRTFAVPGYVAGPPAFDADGAVRVGLARIDGEAWGTEQFNTAYAGYVPGEDRVLVLTRFQPSREIDAVDTYAGPSRQLLLVDSATGALVATLMEDASNLHAGALGTGAGLVVAVDGEQTRIWSAEDGAMIAGDVVEVDPDAPLVLAFSSLAEPDAVATGGPDGAIAVLRDGDVDVVGPDGATRLAWTAHDGPGAAVAFHPERPLLATASRDGLVQLWALDDAEPRQVGSHSATSAGGLCWRDSTTLVVATDVVDRHLVVLHVH